MTVLFHGNFALNRVHLASVLVNGLENPKQKDKELAKPLGYGAPFAAIQRSWLHKTGLCEMGLPLKLTPFGKVVFECDPQLEMLTTQWFLHHELVDDPERAEAWHFFAKKFLPTNKQFERQDLENGLVVQLGTHSMKHFGPGSKLNQRIARKIVQVYTETTGLGELGLLTKNGNEFLRGNPRKKGPWSSPAKLRQSY